jgi:hypothetical protein
LPRCGRRALRRRPPRCLARCDPARIQADVDWHRPQFYHDPPECLWLKDARCFVQLYHKDLWRRYVGRYEGSAEDPSSSTDSGSLPP